MRIPVQIDGGPDDTVECQRQLTGIPPAVRECSGKEYSLSGLRFHSLLSQLRPERPCANDTLFVFGVVVHGEGRALAM